MAGAVAAGSCGDLRACVRPPAPPPPLPPPEASEPFDGGLPPPVPGFRDSLPESARAMLDHVGQARAGGSPATVAERIGRFIERTGADEIIVSGATHDPAKRRRSLEMTMTALERTA